VRIEEVGISAPTLPCVRSNTYCGNNFHSGNFAQIG
jgi:hypothetical protein